MYRWGYYEHIRILKPLRNILHTSSNTRKRLGPRKFISSISRNYIPKSILKDSKNLSRLNISGRLEKKFYLYRGTTIPTGGGGYVGGPVR